MMARMLISLRNKQQVNFMQHVSSKNVDVRSRCKYSRLNVDFTLTHNEPDVLSNQKTDLGSRGDLKLLVYDLHGISSGL